MRVRRLVVVLLAVAMVLTPSIQALSAAEKEDDSGNGYHLEESGSPTTRAGSVTKFGDGVDFDGTDDKLRNTSNSLGENQDAAIVAAFDLDTLNPGDNTPILELRNGADTSTYLSLFYNDANDELRWFSNNINAQTLASIQSTGFYTIAFSQVHDGTNNDVRATVRDSSGSLVNDVNITDTATAGLSNGLLRLGQGSSTSTTLNGAIYELRYWKSTTTIPDHQTLQRIADPSDTYCQDDAAGNETALYYLEDLEPASTTCDTTTSGNQQPTASFTSSCTDLTCTFNASDSTGNITSYDWEFGDGTTGTGEVVTHPYADAGTFQVNLTVTNGTGATDTTSQNVTVVEIDTTTVYDGSTAGLGDVDVSPNDNSFVYACFKTEPGILIVTSEDGGQTWTNSSFLDTTSGFSTSTEDVCRIDVRSNDHIAVCWDQGSDTEVRAGVSTDGGDTWTFNQVSTADFSNCRISWLRAPDGDASTPDLRLTYIAGAQDRIDASDSPDAGSTWEAATTVFSGTVASPNRYPLVDRQPTSDTSFVDGLRMPFFEGNDDIHASPINSNTWSEHSANITSTSDRSVEGTLDRIFTNDTNGWAEANTLSGTATDGRFTAFTTSDAGASWSRQFEIDGEDCHCFQLVAHDKNHAGILGIDQSSTSTNQSSSGPDDVILLFTEDGGQTTNHVIVHGNSTQIDNANPSVSGVMLDSKTYVVTHVNQTTDTAYLTTVSAGTDTTDDGTDGTTGTRDADKIDQGFHNLADIDTDYDLTTPEVWIREEGDTTNNQRQNVYALSKGLNLVHSQRICSGSGFEDFDRISKTDGLSVTHANRPLYICRDSDTNNPALLYALSDGSFHPDLAPHVLGGTQSHIYIPVDSRTGNNIVWPDSDLQLGQVDIFELESHLTSWDWSDIAISQGEKSHVAFTGPDGTRAMTSIGGSLLAPTLNLQFDSIEIHDGTVWAATNQNNEIRRYRLSGQTWNQTHQVNISHTGSSVLDLSPDGRYLALTRPSLVMLYDADTLTQLAAVQDDRAGTFRHAVVSPNNNYLYAIDNDDVFRFPVYNVTSNIDGDAGTDGQENPAPSGTLDLEGDDPLGDDAPIDQSQGLTSFFNIFGQGLTGPGGNGPAFAGLLLVALGAVGLFFITRHPAGAGLGAFLGVLGAFFLNLFELWVPVTFGIVGAAILVVMNR